MYEKGWFFAVHIHMFSKPVTCVQHGIFPLCLLFSHSAALLAEGLLLAFQELTAAHTAVLRPDPLELGAVVAVGAFHQTAAHVIPMLTHIPLPELIPAEFVASDQEQLTEPADRLLDDFLVLF